MERQIINKRKRVFPLQANKNPKAVSARRYVSHLVPALNKINMNRSSSQTNHQSFEQTLKHEVDMAFALSSQEFAWSLFLQHKLLSTEPVSTSSSSEILERSSKKQGGEKHDQGRDNEEGGEIKKRLKELQKLLPGGEEMNMEEILSEIGSYIVCLELQMMVLKSIVEDN